MDNPNIAVKDRFVDAVLGGRNEEIRDLLDPEFELRQAQGLDYAGTYRGFDEFLGFLKRYFAAYDAELLENTRTFSGADPDMLVLEFRSAGKRNSTGQRFDTTILELWGFRNGKVHSIAPHWFEMPG